MWWSVVPNPRELERARQQDPVSYDRKVGLLALYGLIAIGVFIALSWFSAPFKSPHSGIQRIHRMMQKHPSFTSQDHESVPMPAGHLDRG